MAPILYLCRHGQTDWNAEGRLQGQEDIPLNALGREQARRNGEHLLEVLGGGAPGFDFLASPLSRASETMAIMRGALGLEPRDFATDRRLTELHFGDWQGHTLAEIGAWDAAGLKRRKADKWNFVPPGPRGESYAGLAQRVRPVFEALTRPTIVIAHGGVTRSFLHLYGGYGADDASHVDIPQDRILRSEGGTIAWV